MAPLTPAQYAAGDAFVEIWRGARFTWNGRERETGVDCWGLLLAFARAVHARELPDWQRADHSRGWVLRVMSGEWNGAPVLGAPADGCAVVALLAGRPHHVGICWRGGVLHAEDGRGVIWERLPAFAFAHPGHAFREMLL